MKYEINLLLDEIEYDKTIKILLPEIIGKCIAKDERNIFFRLLKRLDDTAVVIASDILSRISEKDKTELLRCLVNYYDSELTGMINRILLDTMGEGARLSGIAVRSNENSPVELVLCNVEFELNTLMNKLPTGAVMLIKPLLKMGAGQEGTILKFIQQNRLIWSALISKLEAKLAEKGFYIHIRDIEINEAAAVLNCANNERSFALSYELEEKLIEAVSSYLRERCC